jgi:DNA-binding NarL/FixJ family response regulator
MRRGIDRIDTEKVVELYESGVPVSEIAEMMDVQQGSIYPHLHKGNVQLRRVPQELVQKAIDQYQQGRPVDAICQDLGITYAGLTYHLKKAGVPRRSQGRPSRPMPTAILKDDNAGLTDLQRKVLRLRAEGMLMKDIAAECGFSTPRVWKIVRSAFIFEDGGSPR